MRLLKNIKEKIAAEKKKEKKEAFLPASSFKD